MDFNTNKSKESIWDKKEEEPSVLIEEQKQSMFLQWNTKPSSDYKLKHYNYYTNSPPQQFTLAHYISYSPLMSNPPSLKHYMRFTQNIYQDDLEKQQKSFYSTFMTDPISAPQTIVYNRPYDGMYSKQPDYYYFKNEEIESNKRKQDS